MLKNLKPQDWQDEIMAGLEYRELYGKEKFWGETERCYYNDPDTICMIGENLIFEQGDALLAGISVSDPYIIIEPEMPSSVDSAPAVETLDNQFIRKLQLKETVEYAALNAYLYGKAIIKLGYDSEFGFDPYFDVSLGGSPSGMTFTQFNKRGERIEFNAGEPGLPWAKSVLPHDFVVAWGSKTLDDAPWCAHRIIRTTADIKADPKYRNTSRLEPNMSMKSFLESYIEGRIRRDRVSTQRQKGAIEASKKSIYNELWEIHDRRTGMLKVICFNYDQFLRNRRDVLQIDGKLPFIADSFTPHTRYFWTTPLAYYLLQHQVEMHDVSKQEVKNRRSSNLKYLVMEDALDSEEEERALSEETGLFVKVGRSAGADLSKVVSKFPTANNINLIMEKGDIRSAARSVIGYSRNQLGEFDDSSRRTATESNNVQRGALKREGRRYKLVENLFLETIKGVNGIVFSFWKRQRQIMVGPQEWQMFAGIDLKGVYSYNIDLTSNPPTTKTQRKFQALQLFSQFLMIPGVNVGELWQYVMRLSDDPGFARFFIQQQQQPVNSLQLPAGASRQGGVGSAQTTEGAKSANL